MNKKHKFSNLSEHLIPIDTTTKAFVSSASYVFPILGTVCTILNFSVLILLIILKLKKLIYSFIQFRLFFKGLFSLFVAFSMLNRLDSSLCWFCKSTQYNSMSVLIIEYTSDFICDIFAHIIGLIELLITVDKLRLLQNKSCLFSKRMALVSASIIGFSIAVIVPKFFTINPELVEDGIYTRVQSQYNSAMYSYYFFGLYVMDICLLCVYIVLLVVLCVKYRMYMLKKGKLKKRGRTKGMLDMTRMLIINGMVYVVAAFLFIAGNVLAKLEEMRSSQNGPSVIIRYASYYLALVLSLSVSPMVVLYYDKNIRRFLGGSVDKREATTTAKENQIIEPLAQRNI